MTINKCIVFGSISLVGAALFVLFITCFGNLFGAEFNYLDMLNQSKYWILICGVISAPFGIITK